MKRTLKEITGERRRCAYCDRALRPNTDYVRVLGHLQEIPTAEQLREMAQPQPGLMHVKDAVYYGYRSERGFRFRHSNTWDGEPYTEMGFWTGGYRGRGWLKGHGLLFCNSECATLFAVAAYQAGMRIPRDRPEVV
jgi:hypothetical protein